MRSLFGKAIWVWVLFLVLAVLNGMLRDGIYVPQWGELWGRLAGTVILLLAMLLVAYIFLRRNAESLTRVRLVLLGMLWLGLSLFFEFAVSHWVMEEPWESVAAHYNVMAGRFHVLVRLVEFAAPIVLGGRLLPLGIEAPDAQALQPMPAAEAQAPAPADQRSE